MNKLSSPLQFRTRNILSTRARTRWIKAKGIARVPCAVARNGLLAIPELLSNGTRLPHVPAVDACARNDTALAGRPSSCQHRGDTGPSDRMSELGRNKK